MSNHQMSDSSRDNGANFEARIAEFFSKRGIDYQCNKRYGKSAVGGYMVPDFMLDDMVVECKWQGKQGGSIFQKWWYLVVGLNQSPLPAIVVIGCHDDQREFAENAAQKLDEFADNHVMVVMEDDFYDFF